MSDYDAMMEEDQERLWNRYRRAFPNDPVPMMSWERGSGAELVALMEQAIRDGRPLTEEAMLKAQGLKPAPPGALT